MMKKSSLGRRSSMMSQGRLSVADRNSSRLLDGKKSLIPKPSFGAKPSRSSSVDRDLNVSCVKKSIGPHTLQRSRSYANFDMSRTSTPCFTPIQQGKYNSLVYSRLQMSEGGGRTSSISGMKSAKKDSRPVAEKSFQQAAQQRVQEFFKSRAPNLVDKGSIKPMTLAMFADLVSFLVAKHDNTLTVNKNNPVEDIATISRIFNYRGKVDKSWPKTVNTPHTWPHVVSFLLWFVELYLVTEELDPFRAMYPENDQDDIDITDPDFKLQLWVPHLLKGFRLYSKGDDDSYEMNLFLNKYKQALGVDEDEVVRLKGEYNSLQNELNNSIDAEEIKEHCELKEARKALQDDIKKQNDYNYETENYISLLIEKCSKIALNMKEYKQRIAAAEESKQKLRQVVEAQEMSQDQKKEIETLTATLKREIQLLNEQIVDYKNVMYKNEIALVGTRTVFDRLVQAYNKDILVNLVAMPELKNVEIAENMTLYLDAEERFQKLDAELRAIKTRLQEETQEKERAMNNANADMQQLENEMICTQDQLDRFTRECQSLGNEINKIKAAINKEKERMDKVRSETEQKITQENDKFKLLRTGEENELAEIRKKKEEFIRDFNEYVETTSNSIKNRRQDIINTQKELQKITEEEMADRKRRIAEVLQSVPGIE